MPVTTAARDLRAGCLSLLDAFKAYLGDERLLRHTWRARPPSFHPPVGYVSNIAESVGHTAGVRTRQFRVELVFAFGVYENAETVDYRDTVRDEFADYLSSRPHHVSGSTLMSWTGAEEVNVETQGDPVVNLAGLAFTLTFDVAEGRD